MRVSSRVRSRWLRYQKGGPSTVRGVSREADIPVMMMVVVGFVM